MVLVKDKVVVSCWDGTVWVFDTSSGFPLLEVGSFQTPCIFIEGFIRLILLSFPLSDNPCPANKFSV